MKKLTLFLLPLLLLALFSGCRQSESQDNPYDPTTGQLPTLAEEKKQKIETAWLSEHESFPCFDDSTTGQTEGLRYYGTYQGYDILFYDGFSILDEAGAVQVGCLSFRHGYKFCLYAFQNGVFYDLSEIYDTNLFNDTALLLVAQAHCTFYDHISKDVIEVFVNPQEPTAPNS